MASSGISQWPTMAQWCDENRIPHLLWTWWQRLFDLVLIVCRHAAFDQVNQDLRVADANLDEEIWGRNSKESNLTKQISPKKQIPKT